MIRAAMMSLQAKCAKHWTRLLDWVERPWRRNYAWTSIQCEGTFRPTAWADRVTPQIRGSSPPVEFPFWPTEIAAVETITATFERHGVDPQTISIEVENCGDLVLVSEAETTQPIPAQLFSANRHGLRRVRWPLIPVGVSSSVAFTVAPTVLNRVTTPLGFADDDLKEIRVTVLVAVFGPRTRT